jgi:hypothetical protein
MYTQVEKAKENKSRAVANGSSEKRRSIELPCQFVDNRPKAIADSNTQVEVNDNLRVKQLKVFQDVVNKSILHTDNLMICQRVTQFNGLNRKKIQRIDNQAWKIALATTASKRPNGQKAIKVNKGYSEDMNAHARVTGENNEGLEVWYYQDNDDFSQTDEQTRIGQMTALFNHELLYHGNRDVVENWNTDEETEPEEEHQKMFHPDFREKYLETTKIALSNLENLNAQFEYISWWEKDIKTHIDWDDEFKPRQKKEAKNWVRKTASDLIKEVKFG